MGKDEDIHELKSKSGQLDSNKFRDILIVRLPDHMKDMFQRIGEELSSDQLLRVYLLLTSGIWHFHREILILALLRQSSIILIQATLDL